MMNFATTVVNRVKGKKKSNVYSIS